MPKGRASPGVGHNSGANLPTQEDVRTALAMRQLIAEQQAALREKAKRVNKKIEGMSIPVSEIKFLEGLMDKSGSEVEQIFRIKWSLIGAVFDKLFEQFDLFSPKPAAPESRAAHYTLGLLAGVRGKELEIPPAVVGDERNQMIAGHQEGIARREAAKQSILSESLDPANAGAVTDGTSGAVAARAAADFAADQKAEGKPNPLVVDGVKYETMRQANAARKRTATPADGELDEAIRLQREMQGKPKPVVTGEVVNGPDDAETPDANEVDASFAADVGDTIGGGEDGSFAGDLASPTDAPVAPHPEPSAGAAPETNVVPMRSHVPAPRWSDYDDDPENWFAVQKAEARRWVESLAEDHVPAITHKGAVAFYQSVRAEQAEARRRAEAVATEIDPEEVKRQEEALRAKGFVAKSGEHPEATKRRRNLTPRK